MYKKVDSQQKFPKMEEEVLKFWQENKIFEKSLENRKDSKEYSFYDGPPFATGTPHYGHIVGSIMKDVVPRYWTMRGNYVERKWGWDCHGLPIENIVEKEMGSQKKKDIEEMGVDKFNELCRSKVLGYVDEWEKVIGRLGRWADMENAYKTMDKDFMESVWWVFKELYDKGLIYESYRSMHICPRCETTLSQSEVAEGYKDIKDLSVIAEFRLNDEENTSVLAWTTTPWTLPGNVALAVGEDIDYVKIEKKDEGKGELVRFILAKNKLEELFGEDDYEIVKEFKGKDLVGKSYRPLFSAYLDKNEELLKTVKSDDGKQEVPILAVVNDKGEVLLGYRNYMKDKQHVGRDYWIAPGGKVEVGETVKQAIGRELQEECNITDFKIKKYLGGYNGLLKDHNMHVYLLEINDLSQLKNNEPEKFAEWKFFSVEQLPVNDFPNKETDQKFLVEAIQWHNAYKIYSADFVTTEDGTGVVHIAPAFGEDDMNLGKEKNLPFVQHVSMDGTFKKELGEMAGLNVKPAGDHTKTDVEIIKYLAKNGLLFSKQKYEHSYPHCWRCDTPLINYATSSWFVKVTGVKDEALELAKEINWSPEHIKEGRFGNWLEGARDWSISRQRFWASVMPIWKCECGEMKVFGNVSDLEKISGQKIDDLHKHIVDKITFKCEKCDGMMKRIPDVLDTWFDSGSMPYAQKHYPFENEERFKKTFPADFIAEGIDQTRAWFYYLHVIGTAIERKPAFKNVIVNGIVLAEDGKKMAKKLKNYPDPMLMFEKYGADAVRFYLMSSPVVAAQNLNFSEKDVSEVVRGMLRMLWNSYSFFVMYADIDKFEADKNFDPSQMKNLLDKWMISELHTLIRDFNMHMENYELHRASRLLPTFVDQLSNWYIRRSRRRFWKSEDDSDKKDAYNTLYYVLVELSKVMAPFMPFISEEIFKNLTGKESVHLEDLPVYDEKFVDGEMDKKNQVMHNEVLIDDFVNEKMRKVRDIISLGLQLRAQAKIKVRQPLSEIKILVHTLEKGKSLGKDFDDMIKEELNIKDVKMIYQYPDHVMEHREDNDWIHGELNGLHLYLCVKITEDLRLEGVAREVVRAIQQMRKDAGYEVDNRIEVGHQTESKVFEKFGELIFKETLADKNISGKLEGADLEKEFEMDGEKFNVSIRRS